jgi:hypothetical protein
VFVLHTAKKITKIKRADQILPEVYGTTLSTGEVRTEKPQNVPFLNNSLESGVLKVRPFFHHVYQTKLYQILDFVCIH